MFKSKNKIRERESRDAAQASRLQEIKTRVHGQLLHILNLNEARNITPERLRAECSDRVDSLLIEHGASLSATEKTRVLREVIDEIFGLGPIEGFLHDPSISDILVNGPSQVYIERNGKLESTDVRFRDAEHVLQMVHRIAARVGRRIDESSPMLDARLADGSRVNAIIPPLALGGPIVSIRRFGINPIDIDRLLELGSLTKEMALFFKACVRSRLNILISGGTGTGKTTLLNALSKWIPDGERVVTIEDAAELKIQREHVVSLESRPPNIEGRGEVTQRELLRNSLRMRPDRIIIGEVRGAEALDMLQAMNTGHEGSMTTVHANSPRDALSRVENMVSMDGLNYPVRAIRHKMVSALSLLIHVGRLAEGVRRILYVSETVGMEGDVILLQDLFRFRKTGISSDGHVSGQFEGCGVRPRVLTRLAADGFELPKSIFDRRALGDGSPTR